MNMVFYYIITAGFILSLITTIMYFKKIYTVLKFDHSEKTAYMLKAYPAVKSAKVWNMI